MPQQAMYIIYVPGAYGLLDTSRVVAIQEEEDCPRGLFPCGNLTDLCLEAKYWCDKIHHCPNKEDELFKYCSKFILFSHSIV